MSKGFHSKVDIGNGIDDIKENVREVIKETAAISKDVYESIESKGIYSSMSLDEQLSNQIQEMKNEKERLEELKQKEEIKEEKSQTKEPKSKSNEAEHER